MNLDTFHPSVTIVKSITQKAFKITAPEFREDKKKKLLGGKSKVEDGEKKKKNEQGM